LVTAHDRRRYGTWPKIIRAEEHLAAIEAEVALYAESHPYEIVGEFDADRLNYRATMRVRSAPTLRLSLLVGDFAHCLRSALDHAAGWLVAMNGGTPDDTTQFPIYSIAVNKKGNPRVVAVTPDPPGVSVESLALIESLQPYHRGDQAAWDPLALVQSLDNTDKHRNLLLASAVLVDAQVTVAFGDGAMLNQLAFGTFDHGAEVAVFPFTNPHPEADDVKVYAQGAALVTFSEPVPPEDEPVVPTLRTVLDYVRDKVVRGLESTETAIRR
jgi:hypothetical protein